MNHNKSVLICLDSDWVSRKHEVLLRSDQLWKQLPLSQCTR